MSPFAQQFKNKRVLVTGAGKGVGRALVVELHGLGAEVYAVSRTQTDLDSLVAECPGVKAIKLDVSEWDETKRILTAAVPDDIDVLYNNAGVLDRIPHLEVTSESFDRIFNTNIKAVLNVTQVCVTKMIAKGAPGIVVNVSSVAGHRPGAMVPIYSVSKAALDAMTKTMAADFGKHKIRVVGFNPGLIDTPMGSTLLPKTPEAEKAVSAMIAARCPLGDLIIPMSDVINSMLFLGSGMASMMTGSGFLLDGGFCST